MKLKLLWPLFVRFIRVVNAKKWDILIVFTFWTTLTAYYTLAIVFFHEQNSQATAINSSNSSTNNFSFYYNPKLYLNNSNGLIF